MSVSGSNKENGDKAFKTKNFVEAIYWYTIAIVDEESKNEINETAIGVLYSNRAASYSSSDRPDRALADALMCVKHRPDWFKGYYRAAMASDACNLGDEAMEYVEKAILLSPGHDDSLAQLSKRIAEKFPSGRSSHRNSSTLYSWGEGR